MLDQKMFHYIYSTHSCCVSANASDLEAMHASLVCATSIAALVCNCNKVQKCTTFIQLFAKLQPLQSYAIVLPPLYLVQPLK